MTIESLKCENCNSTLEYNKDKPILFCPYCGGKKLIVESDEVKIQENNNATKIKMQDAQYNHEVEMRVLKHNIKKDERKSESKDALIALAAGAGLFLIVAIGCAIFAWLI